MASWAPTPENVRTKPKDTPIGENSFAPSPIHLIKNPGLSLNPAGPDVRPSDLPQESMPKLLGNTTLEGLPVALGALGSLAGPEGTAVGAGTGATVRDLLQSKLNDTPKPTIGDQAITFGKNALITAIAGQAGGMAADAFPGPVQSRLASALATGIVGQGAKAVEGAATGQPVDTSAPALGKDVLTNLGFDIVGGALVRRGVKSTPAGKAAQPREITVGEGFGQLRKDVGGTETPVTRVEAGTQARVAIKDKLKGVTQLERAQRKAFDQNHLENNTIEIPQSSTEVPTGLFDAEGKPITRKETRTAKISGPIYTNNATLKAAEFAPQITKFMQGEEFESLTEGQKNRFRELDRNITKLISGTPTIGADGKETSIPVLDYKTAKEMKTIISQTVGGKQFKTSGEGGLTALAKALDADIDESVKNWKGGTQALQDLNEMNRTSQFKKTVFSKEIQDRIYGKDSVTGRTDVRYEGDPSQMFKEAYKSPEKAQRFMKALGEENKGIFKQDYLDNELGPKGFGTNFDKFEPRKIITELEDPNSISRTILSAEERNGILRFVRAAEASPGIKNKALSFQGNMVSLGAGALARLATGGVGPAANAVGTSVRIGTNELFHAIAAKPEIAEYASRLVKIPSNSTEADLLTKKLMRGLVGSTVTVDVNGKEKEGTILESGKVKFE